MSEKFQVTVLITTFNGEKTLDKCLESLLNQTYKNFKIIVVNDNSTDQTITIFKKWQKKFGKNRFTILRNLKNLGIPKSSNKGIKAVNTPFIARIDSDDWWHPKKLELQIDFLNNNPEYKFIGCSYLNIDSKNKKERKIIKPENNQTIKKTILKNNPFGHSCVIYSTKIAKKIGGYDETIKYGSDFEIYLRFFPRTKFHNIQKILCYREISNEGISRKKSLQRNWQSIKTKIKYIKKYNLPISNYSYLIIPIILILIPNFVKKIKRNLIG